MSTAPESQARAHHDFVLENGSNARGVYTYGFVGVGTMCSAIVRGLCTLPQPPASIIISPRNAAKAAALSHAHPAIVTVAASNQDVLDRSHVVFVGVLPKQCEEVLRALKFSPHHVVVSLVSTSPLALLVPACAPALPSNVVRAIPLPPVAIHRGATVMTPPHPLVHSLFQCLGHVVAVGSEAQLKQLLPVTCLMGQFYEQQRCTQLWLQRQGIDAETAAGWTGAVFHSMSYDSSRAHAATFAELVHEQTPGGLNEGILNGMRAAGVYSALNHQLDLALARVEARAPAAAACVWPSVIVPAAAAADSTAEEQAKLEVATQVYARVLPLMGAGAGRVTDMLLASLTASELRAALDVQGELQARVQRLASLLP